MKRGPCETTHLQTCMVHSVPCTALGLTLPLGAATDFSVLRRTSRLGWCCLAGLSRPDSTPFSNIFDVSLTSLQLLTQSI